MSDALAARLGPAATCARSTRSPTTPLDKLVVFVPHADARAAHRRAGRGRRRARSATTTAAPGRRRAPARSARWPGAAPGGRRGRRDRPRSPRPGSRWCVPRGRRARGAAPRCAPRTRTRSRPSTCSQLAPVPSRRGTGRVGRAAGADARCAEFTDARGRGAAGDRVGRARGRRPGPPVPHRRGLRRLGRQLRRAGARGRAPTCSSPPTSSTTRGLEAVTERGGRAHGAASTPRTGPPRRRGSTRWPVACATGFGTTVEVRVSRTVTDPWTPARAVRTATEGARSARERRPRRPAPPARPAGRRHRAGPARPPPRARCPSSPRIAERDAAADRGCTTEVVDAQTAVADIELRAAPARERRRHGAHPGGHATRQRLQTGGLPSQGAREPAARDRLARPPAVDARGRAARGDGAAPRRPRPSWPTRRRGSATSRGRAARARGRARRRVRRDRRRAARAHAPSGPRSPRRSRPTCSRSTRRRARQRRRRARRCCGSAAARAAASSCPAAS